jgi:molybdopterin-guanine dinucleotide biosynthesis protein A
VTSPPTSRVPVVVLAGGKAKPEMQAATGQTNRALVVVNGKPLLHHVVDALRASEVVGEIVVVGDVPDSEVYARLPDQGDFVSNVAAGVAAFASAPFVLITTSDLPFLTGDIVTHFITASRERAETSGAAFVWPVVPVAACYARFPGVKRTALRLREGAFTGGNLMLARPERLLSQKQRIADAHAARKSVLRLAVILGPGTLLRLALSQLLSPALLTLPYLESRVSRLLGVPARALISDSAEIATDLDRPSDFGAIAQHSATH